MDFTWFQPEIGEPIEDSWDFSIPILGDHEEWESGDLQIGDLWKSSRKHFQWEGHFFFSFCFFFLWLALASGFWLLAFGFELLASAAFGLAAILHGFSSLFAWICCICYINSLFCPWVSLLLYGCHAILHEFLFCINCLHDQKKETKSIPRPFSMWKPMVTKG